MEKSKVDMFLSMNSGNFKQSDLMMIKEKLEKLDDDKYTGKSFIFLKKLASKLEALANDKNATESERVVAERKLKRVADARDEAKKNQYSKKKKK